MTYVLFDVGANFGTDSLPQTRDNPDCKTFAFEPTPELCEHLRKSSISFTNRYRIFPFALSDYNGTATFNVAAHNDWGTSSLLDFSDDLAATWPGRGDFYVDRKIDVTVMRFDTWMEITKPDIEKIDFFHCDTQGSDLAVLRGMGDYFGLIVEGCVEVPRSEAVKLYKEQHSKEDTEAFLADRGYEVFRVESQMNEDNLFFRKKS